MDNAKEQSGGAGSARVDRVGPLLGGRGVLHHLGLVVASISAVAEGFALAMSAHWDGQVIHDPLHRVRVAFFSPADARNLLFELVEPAGGASPVRNFLLKGEGYITSVTKLTTWNQPCGKREMWGLRSHHLPSPPLLLEDAGSLGCVPEAAC